MQFKWEIRALSPALLEYYHCCLQAFTSVSTIWDVQHAYLCCISCKDPRQCGLGCLKYPTSSIMCFPMNFAWYMRIVSTSHFDSVGIPKTVSKEVTASTVGTKDPLLSDECSSSERSKPYPVLSVSNIKVVCMFSFL